MTFKKSVFTLAILVLSVSFSFTCKAANKSRQILGPEIKEKMLNAPRTFFHFSDIDRFYFEPDGKLEHQINQDWGNIPVGTTLSATWRIKNDQSLCWQYSEDEIQEFAIEDSELCFDLYTKETKSQFMDGFRLHPDIKLKPEGKPKNTKSVFRFYSWQRGDYRFDPKYVENVYKAHNKLMGLIREHSGKLPKGTINRDIMNARMQEYYDLKIGRVMSINVDYMYFDPSGDYYWITEPDIEKANGDIEEMIKATKIGVWSVQDNFICWHVNNGSCEYIFPKGVGLLTQSFDTFLGTFHTGMTRIHHDNLFHLDFDQTAAPELFKRLAQMSKDARAK